MNKLILILFTTISFLSCQAQNSEHYQLLDAKRYAMAIQQQDIILIDVRTAQEYNQGKIGNAVNINYMDKNFLESMQQYDKHQPIYIYCQSGNRSGKAARLLIENGFTNIVDLAGGYGNWPHQ